MFNVHISLKKYWKKPTWKFKARLVSLLKTSFCFKFQSFKFISVLEILDSMFSPTFGNGSEENGSKFFNIYENIAFFGKFLFSKAILGKRGCQTRFCISFSFSQDLITKKLFLKTVPNSILGFRSKRNTNLHGVIKQQEKENRRKF